MWLGSGKSICPRMAKKGGREGGRREEREEGREEGGRNELLSLTQTLREGN